MIKSFLLVLENVTGFPKKVPSFTHWYKIRIKILVLFHAYLKFQSFCTKKWNILGHLTFLSGYGGDKLSVLFSFPKKYDDLLLYYKD